MSKSQWETEQIGHAAIVRGSEDELRALRIALKNYINVDVHDSINIEFIENDEKNLVEKYKALSYLKNCFDIPPTKIDDPTLYPELLSNLSDKNYAIPPIGEFNKLEINVHCLMASFLVEIFCPNQLPDEQYRYEKRFFQQKTIYNLLIYASLPVSIETVVNNTNNTSYCVIKFADTEIASAQVIHDQVMFALKTFQSTKTCCALYNQVDIEPLKPSYLKKLSDEFDCAFLKTSDFNVYENRGNFYLYVLPNQFGQEPRRKIHLILQNLFSNVQLFQCDKCRKLITSSNQEECVIQSFDEQDEDMVFPRHQLSGVSPSEFYFQVM